MKDEYVLEGNDIELVSRSGKNLKNFVYFAMHYLPFEGMVACQTFLLMLYKSHLY